MVVTQTGQIGVHAQQLVVEESVQELDHAQILLLSTVVRLVQVKY